MKTKITLLAAGVLMYFSSSKAQTLCTDMNGFVNYKNVGPTGSYQLKAGFEEYAGQTYHYAGPGKVSSARVYGNYPGVTGGVPLKVGVYNVDVAGRPTTLISSVNTAFYTFDNAAGYINVNFGGGGVTVNNNFAITVQVLSGFPFGNTFNLQYTGNGEGGGQDLASLMGTSTGFNWASAKVTFSKDGDFYLVPKMTHFITSGFVIGSSCYATSAPVSFTNTTAMTKDSMFNKIGLTSYAGSNKFYTWNFGDGSAVSYVMNPTHTYTAPGVYTASLTSTIEGWTGTCTNVYTKKISVGLTAIASSTNVTCNGGNDGCITGNATGGSSPYTYLLLSPYSLYSAGFCSLSAGVYTLVAKDNLGCISNVSVAVTQPTPISFTTASSTNATCAGSDGSILVGATGGVGALQYKLNSGSYQGSGAFTNLSAGAYTITARDANSCTVSTIIIVNDLGGPAFTNINPTNASCNGYTDGSITLTSFGGTGTILYSNNGGSTYQSSNVFSSLGAGVYVVMVKDAAGCTDVSTVTISQAATISVTATSGSVSCNGSNNGQINVTSSTGGIGTHNYSINNISYQSGTAFYGLVAGTYTVYVKDVAGCMGTTTVSVTQPSPISAGLVTTQPACNGSTDGGITATATGGTPGYMYSLNGVNFQGVGVFTELSAGVYTVTVKDANGCLYTTTTSISQPAAITATVNTTNSTCGNTNGGILVAAGGGIGSGYQYSINGTTFNSTGSFTPLAAGTYFIIVKDGSGCQKVVSATVVDSNGPTIVSNSSTNVSCNGGTDGTITITNVTGGTGALQYSINGTNFQASPSFTGLPAGTYVVTVKDVNGCTGTVTVVLTQPSGFVISATTSSLACNGNPTGSASILASGGAGILAYSLNGGAFQGSNLFNNLPAGTYTVAVKDAGNCQGYQTFSIAQPPAINITLGLLNVSCNGLNNGAITVSAGGGTGTLLYSLNGSSYSASNQFTGLAGSTNYVVYVKDANGCVQTQNAYLTEPALLTVSSAVTNVKCSGGNNGAISLSVNGGTSPYSFQWSNGATTQGISNLTAGSYSVNVIDFNGCVSVKSYVVTQPANPIIVNGVVTGASTSSSGDGNINITVTGGSAPYSFSWSNGATTQNISGLNPGAYLVTITDANGCITSATYIVGNFTGIANIKISSSDIKLYPNPANTVVTIDAAGNRITKLEMVNMLGQVVYTSEPKESVANIELSNIEAGTYFVKINVNGYLLTKKVVVSK